MKIKGKFSGNKATGKITLPFRFEDDFEAELFARRFEDVIHELVKEFKIDVNRVRKGKHIKK